MTLMVLFNQNFLSDSFVTFVKSNKSTFDIPPSGYISKAHCALRGGLGLRPAVCGRLPGVLALLCTPKMSPLRWASFLQRSRDKVKTSAVALGSVPFSPNVVPAPKSSGVVLAPDALYLSGVLAHSRGVGIPFGRSFSFGGVAFPPLCR